MHCKADGKKVESGGKTGLWRRDSRTRLELHFPRFGSHASL